MFLLNSVEVLHQSFTLKNSFLIKNNIRIEKIFEENLIFKIKIKCFRLCDKK